jgi:acetyl-CoA carboxylase carboxyltransferase component
MHTAVPDFAHPAPTRGALTLMDWVNAQAAVLEEEQRLHALAERHCRHQDGPEALERQRIRVQVAQDAADAIYDTVMKDLRAS